MKHIKYDLLNEIANDRYYLDKDLINLINNENIGYKDKIFKIKEILREIILTDSSKSLVEQIFVDEDDVNDNDLKKEQEKDK